METCSVFPMLNCNLNGRKSFETALFDALKKAEIASTQNVEKNLATDDRSPYNRIHERTYTYSTLCRIA